MLWRLLAETLGFKFPDKYFELNWLWLWMAFHIFVNPFVLNAPFLYPLKTSENLNSFLMFSQKSVSAQSM